MSGDTNKPSTHVQIANPEGLPSFLTGAFSNSKVMNLLKTPESGGSMSSGLAAFTGSNPALTAQPYNGDGKRIFQTLFQDTSIANRELLSDIFVQQIVTFDSFLNKVGTVERTDDLAFFLYDVIADPNFLPLANRKASAPYISSTIEKRETKLLHRHAGLIIDKDYADSPDNMKILDMRVSNVIYSLNMGLSLGLLGVLQSFNHAYLKPENCYGLSAPPATVDECFREMRKFFAAAHKRYNSVQELLSEVTQRMGRKNRVPGKIIMLGTDFTKTHFGEGTRTYYATSGEQTGERSIIDVSLVPLPMISQTGTLHGWHEKFLSRRVRNGSYNIHEDQANGKIDPARFCSNMRDMEMFSWNDRMENYRLCDSAIHSLWFHPLAKPGEHKTYGDGKLNRNLLRRLIVTKEALKAKCSTQVNKRDGLDMFVRETYDKRRGKVVEHPIACFGECKEGHYSNGDLDFFAATVKNRLFAGLTDLEITDFNNGMELANILNNLSSQLNISEYIGKITTEKVTEAGKESTRIVGINKFGGMPLTRESLTANPKFVGFGNYPGFETIREFSKSFPDQFESKFAKSCKNKVVSFLKVYDKIVKAMLACSDNHAGLSKHCVPWVHKLGNPDEETLIKIAAWYNIFDKPYEFVTGSNGTVHPLTIASENSRDIAPCSSFDEYGTHKELHNLQLFKSDNSRLKSDNTGNPSFETGTYAILPDATLEEEFREQEERNSFSSVPRADSSYGASSENEIVFITNVERYKDSLPFLSIHATQYDLFMGSEENESSAFHKRWRYSFVYPDTCIGVCMRFFILMEWTIQNLVLCNDKNIDPPYTCMVARIGETQDMNAIAIVKEGECIKTFISDLLVTTSENRTTKDLYSELGFYGGGMVLDKEGLDIIEDFFASTVLGGKGCKFWTQHPSVNLNGFRYRQAPLIGVDYEHMINNVGKGEETKEYSNFSVMMPYYYAKNPDLISPHIDVTGHWHPNDFKGKMNSSRSFGMTDQMYPGMLFANMVWRFEDVKHRVYQMFSSDAELTFNTLAMNRLSNTWASRCTKIHWTLENAKTFTNSMTFHGDEFEGCLSRQSGTFRPVLGDVAM